MIHLKGKNLNQRAQAVIFDLDGTLLNSEPIHAKALSLELASYKIQYGPEELEEKFTGISDFELYYKLKANHSQIPNLNQFIKNKNDHVDKLLSALNDREIKEMLVPGADELLSKLDQRGVPLGLVSASEVQIVERSLKKMNIRKYFKVVNGRTNTHLSKPNPSPYLMAMRKLGVSAKNTFIFEDSNTGIAAARLSGATVIQVKYFKEANSLFEKSPQNIAIECYSSMLAKRKNRPRIHPILTFS